MREPNQLLEEIAANTRLIAQLLAASVAAESVGGLSALLDSDAKRLAYMNSDGQRSTRDIAKVAGVSHTTIAAWWKEWVARGIAEEADDGRARGSIDLTLVGIAGPFAGAND